MSRSPIEDEVQKGEFRWTGHALIDGNRVTVGLCRSTKARRAHFKGSLVVRSLRRTSVFLSGDRLLSDRSVHEQFCQPKLQC